METVFAKDRAEWRRWLAKNFARCYAFRFSPRKPKSPWSKSNLQRAAWANYEKFPPGYRRMTAGWVASAKKEETRIKRLEELIDYSARNERVEFM